MNGSDEQVPVITVDGWNGAGKGEARGRVAKLLGFHELDSGLVYRAIAYCANRAGIEFSDIHRLAAIGEELTLEMKDGRAILNGRDETDLLKSLEVGSLATEIGGITEVRAVVNGYQKRMRQLPGLVVDGRIGAFEFGGRVFRIFLIAADSVRAKRRVKEFQTNRNGKYPDYAEVLNTIQERDRVDRQRKVATLEPHPQAIIIDTSFLAPEEVADCIVALYRSSLV